jgi:hypothetical protein
VPSIRRRPDRGSGVVDVERRAWLRRGAACAGGDPADLFDHLVALRIRDRGGEQLVVTADRAELGAEAAHPFGAELGDIGTAVRNAFFVAITCVRVP